MSTLKLVWENTPDTPLDAQNLSKTVEKYSEGPILYVDRLDSSLKLRANSKVSLPVRKTSAFFDFENTMVSHDGRYSPTTAHNVSFRNEMGHSIAVESGTTNLLANSSFENGLASWTASAGGNGSVSASAAALFGGSCAALTVDSFGNDVSLSQTATLLPPSQGHDIVSVSFYYKSAYSGLKVTIVGDPTPPAVIKYWRSLDVNSNWESGLEQVTLPAVSDWTRVEIANIYTTNLTSRQIRLKLSASTAGGTYYVDGTQVEALPFCTSFTAASRQVSTLVYPGDMFRSDEGLVDVTFILKQLASENVLIAAKTATVDAFRLGLVAGAPNMALFSAYDTATSAYVSAGIDLSTLSSYRDTPLRILCTWNRSGVSIRVNDRVAWTPTSFTPFASSAITATHIGGNFSGGTPAGLAQGLFSNLKVNIFKASDSELAAMRNGAAVPDPNEYNLYENLNSACIISPDMGVSWIGSTDYYLWLCKDATGLDQAALVVSRNPTAPTGYDGKFSAVIGGFATDASAQVIERTVWDVATKSEKITVLHQMFYNPETDFIGAEYKNNIGAGTADFTFDVPTYFNRQVTLTDTLVSGQFLSIDKAGRMDLDDLRLDGGTVSTRTGAMNVTGATALTLTALGLLTVTTTGSNTVRVESQNVELRSGNGGTNSIDKVYIKDSTIYPLSGNHLLINSAANSSISFQTNGNGFMVSTGTMGITASGAVTASAAEAALTIPVFSLSSATSASISSAAGTLSFGATLGVSAPVLTVTSPTSVGITTPTLTLNGNAVISAPSSLWFGSSTRQTINLFGTNFGVGVQSNATYFRSSNHFAWYKAGAHDSTFPNPGLGGGFLAALTDTQQTGLQNSVSTDSCFYTGRVFNAVYNDVAECWRRDPGSKIEYGMVVVQTEHGVRPSRRRAERGVAGIVSDSYGHLLGSESFDEDLSKSEKVPIAIAGRARVRVCTSKEVRIGDELVSTINGCAVKANWFERVFLRDRIVGRIDAKIDGGLHWVKVY